MRRRAFGCQCWSQNTKDDKGWVGELMVKNFIVEGFKNMCGGVVQISWFVT